jgi:hypothetical protein
VTDYNEARGRPLTWIKVEIPTQRQPNRLTGPTGLTRHRIWQGSPLVQNLRWRAGTIPPLPFVSIYGAGVPLAWCSTALVPAAVQSGQSNTASSSMEGAAKKYRQWGHCRLTMPGGGSQGSALIARASASSSFMPSLLTVLWHRSVSRDCTGCPTVKKPMTGPIASHQAANRPHWPEKRGLAPRDLG